MQKSNFMMALLIPGPKSLGKDFDVFLEPLIEDLLDLWKGVPTYDEKHLAFVLQFFGAFMITQL